MKPSHDQSAHDERVDARVTFTVAAALFMFNLDSTVLVTALPAMAQSFGVEPLNLSIGISSYLLASTSVLPLSVWLAGRLGYRAVFAGAIAVFTLASLLCALAGTLELFVAARVLQGIGGGLMMPVGRMVALRDVPKPQMIHVISAITWPGLIAPLVGPPLGGLIVQHAQWPLIFLINIPVGLAAIAAAFLILPPGRPEARRFDGIGAALNTIALVLVVAGLEALAAGHIGESGGLGLLTLGLFAGILAVRHSRRAADPMLDLSLFRFIAFRLASIGPGALYRIVIHASPFLLPLLFQTVLGYDALVSGLLLLAYMSANLLMKTVTTPLLMRFGFRAVLLVNGAVLAMATMSGALFVPDLPLWVIVLLLFVSGLARSMQFTALATLTFRDVPQVQRSDATALSSVAQQVSQTLGIALAALMVALSQGMRGADNSAIADFQSAFLFFGLLGLGATIWMLRLPRDEAAEDSGARAASAS